MNAVRIEIGRFSRDQPQYLVLFQKEHQLIKEEKPIQEELEKCEKSEKKAFHEFQAARQTTRVEEKKYSAITRYRIVIGHLIAFIFGLFGTIICFVTSSQSLKRFSEFLFSCD